MEHKLLRLSSTRTTGHPHDGCYAACTCGLETATYDTLSATGEAFDAHLRAVGIHPSTIRAPWRE